jgi:serine protease Do
VGALVRWIGHDAAIYGGNSGGPLVNLNGEIVGINEISFGLSGAIPANLAREVGEQLIAKGKIRRSWLGIDVQPLFKHAGEEHGVIIAGVLPDSPASRAGAQVGDALLRLNGTVTDVRFDEQMPEFMRLTTSLPIGKEVSAVIRRGGQEITLHLTAVERGEIFLKEHELKEWGFTARNISFLLAREMKRDGLDGVLVTSVRPGGPSGEAKPALEPGDVLVEVNGTAVKGVQELKDLTRKLTEGRAEPAPVVATFERKAARYLAVVKVGIQELKDPGLEVSKAWLPVETHAISREIAKELGDPALKGFYITRVYAGSTAATAGLKPGDFILAVDGEKLSASGSEYEDELTTLIRQYDIGKTVELTVRREKADLKISVELVRSPRLKREMKKYRDDEFEFTARDVSFFDAAEQQWNRDQRGALVEEVKSGSWAELGSLGVGDLILEVDTQPVNTVDDLRHQLERVAAARKTVVLLRVLRGIHTLFLELEPNWKT